MSTKCWYRCFCSPSFFAVVGAPNAGMCTDWCPLLSLCHNISTLPPIWHVFTAFLKTPTLTNTLKTDLWETRFWILEFSPTILMKPIYLVEAGLILKLTVSTWNQVACMVFVLCLISLHSCCSHFWGKPASWQLVTGLIWWHLWLDGQLWYDRQFQHRPICGPHFWQLHRYIWPCPLLL